MIGRTVQCLLCSESTPIDWHGWIIASGWFEMDGYAYCPACMDGKEIEDDELSDCVVPTRRSNDDDGY